MGDVRLGQLGVHDHHGGGALPRLFEKFSAIIGPFIFSAVDRITGSSRGAVLSLVAFFIVGGLILSRVDVDEARRSRLRWSFAADEAKVG